MASAPPATRGRPARPLPPRIDASADELAERMMRTLPIGERRPKLVINPDADYHCVVCARPVYYPEILYRDGKCEECHNR